VFLYIARGNVMVKVYQQLNLQRPKQNKTDNIYKTEEFLCDWVTIFDLEKAMVCT
jgi:hypothetical protein